MAKNDVKVTDNPKLKKKVLSDGNYSLYLEYYLGYTKELDEETGEYKIKNHRKKEFLSLVELAHPRTPMEREQNKQVRELANKIREEREQQFKADTKGYRLEREKDVDFLQLFQTYIDNYTKKDKRMIEMALRRFKEFFEETPEYNQFKNGIKPSQITKDMVQTFVEFLNSKGKGEGPKSVFQRFKKVIAWAVDKDYIKKDVTRGITITVDKEILRKDILSMDEIEKLINTHYEGENTEIRRAFIFCCYCGLRYCDVVRLTYNNIDFSNKFLKFEQSKTKGHSANSGVEIPLNDGILKLVGNPDEHNMNDLIFHLPSHTMCLKALKHWVARAGIQKHITWHCGRHSFAVNILNNGANIKTVASLLGHSGLKHTEKYTRAVDELKQRAIDSLPELKTSNV